MTDVVQDGLRALEPKHSAFDAVLRRKVKEALVDPRPTIPAAEVFANLRKRRADHR